MNSTAALKAFCGERGGVVCTSSNARTVLEWAWRQKPRVFFFPDQHLGRNTAFSMGVPLEHMARVGLARRGPERANAACVRTRDAHLPVARLLLRAHQVHARAGGRGARRRSRGAACWCTRRCPFEVVQAADLVGSTEYIIEQVRAGAERGTHWAIGTEINLVHRLALEHPEQNIQSLQKNVCPCATMNRIDPAHLLWALENLAAGHVVNAVRVPDDVRRGARVALDRMLSLKGTGAPVMARD